MNRTQYIIVDIEENKIIGVYPTLEKAHSILASLKALDTDKNFTIHFRIAEMTLIEY